MASLEAEEAARFDLFNSAVKHMKTVRKFVDTVEGRAGSDIEIGRIMVLKAKAESEFGNKGKAHEYTREAIAAYQTLILLGDINDQGVKAHIEDAYVECAPLLVQIERWEDVVDDCDAYVDLFPDGRHAVGMRNFRSTAKMRLAQMVTANTGPGSGGEQQEPGVGE